MSLPTWYAKEIDSTHLGRFVWWGSFVRMVLSQPPPLPFSAVEENHTEMTFHGI